MAEEPSICAWKVMPIDGTGPAGDTTTLWKVRMMVAVREKVEATFLKNISWAVPPSMLHIWFQHYSVGIDRVSLFKWETPFFCCGILAGTGDVIWVVPPHSKKWIN